MDSEAPTNLEHKLWLTEKPAPINCIVFSGTLVKRSVQGFKYEDHKNNYLCAVKTSNQQKGLENK